MTTLPTQNTKTEVPPPVGRTRYLLTPLPEPGHFLFVIDNSAAERFVCPTLAKNYLVDGREPHPTDAALIFGGALHVGIEELLQGPRLLESQEAPIEMWETNAELLARAQRRLTKFFTDHPAPLDEYRTLTNALEVLRFYQQRCMFPDYNIEILSDDKGPLIERAFELPLGVLEVNAEIVVAGKPTYVSHIHVAWAGRIDVVARVVAIRGTTCVIDHKTTSQGGKDFIEDFWLSSQTRGYLWAAKQLWPELSPTHFCLDAIKLKRPSAGCALMDRGPRGGEPALDFFRSYFEYDEASIDQWAENALVRVEDFIHCMIRGLYPMETTYCFNRKYGKCPYHDVCMIAIRSQQAAHNLLHSDAFRQVTWNPTADR